MPEDLLQEWKITISGSNSRLYELIQFGNGKQLFKLWLTMTFYHKNWLAAALKQLSTESLF